MFDLQRPLALQPLTLLILMPLLAVGCGPENPNDGDPDTSDRDDGDTTVRMDTADAADTTETGPDRDTTADTGTDRDTVADTGTDRDTVTDTGTDRDTVADTDTAPDTTTDPPSFQDDVRPIIDKAGCASGKCHGYGTFAQGLDLMKSSAYDSLVETPSEQCNDRLRVDPGSPSSSYLLDKLRGENLCRGRRMPPGIGAALASSDIATIRDWIAAGAPDN